MADAPQPPQIDYPYAARVQPEPSAPEAASPFETAWLQWAERCDEFFEALVTETPALTERIAQRHTPAIVATICFFAAVNVLPLVAVELFQRTDPPDWLAISIVAPLIGIIAAEFILFAAALVWWPDRFVWRLAAHWLLALGLLACWSLGFIVLCSLHHENPADELRAILMEIPMICLAVQAPLWCLKIYGGWSLVDASLPVSSPAAHFSIRDILLGTGIVAVSLAALRAMFDKPSEFGEHFWLGWAIAGGCIALASFLTVAPLIRLIFGIARMSLTVLCIGGYWLAIVATIIPLCYYLVPPSEWKSMALALSLVTLTGLATVTAALRCVRDWGIQLRIGGR